MTDSRLMERRTLDVRGVQVRDAGDGGGRELTGIAVSFNTRYAMFADYAEVFDPDTDFGDRSVVKISREHGELIGRVTGMSAETDGLHITARLSDTAAARETAQLVRDGVYDGFSVGFAPVENRTEYSADGVTEVHRRKVDLFEVAVTGIPAYPDATITGLREARETSENTTDDDSKEERHMDEELKAMLDGIKEEQRGMKAALAKGAATERRTLGGEYRSAGDYLRALTDGDEAAVSLMHECRDMIVTGDTGNTVTWIADDLRLIQQRRKVTNLLTHDTLPATGMSMEYNVVASDTTAVNRQNAEGDALTFGKVTFGTKNADINTYGGYTTLSRQVIERSTTPMLNTALSALRNAYAKATENAVRKFLYDTIAAQRDAAKDANKIDAPAALDAMTIDQWAGLIMDAAELADDRNVSLTRLGVSKDVMLALIKLKDTGTRFFDLSGDGSDTIGDFDLTGIAGRFLRLPVQMLPAAPAGTACFIDPEAVTVWESGGPTQLSNGDPTKLTENYSVYGYMAVAATHTPGLIPVKFAAAAGA
ncbi:MAG: HK97 family phage prohead protease [Bifidobacterium scardovii]|uniref:HK97 family phage prohead protease n=1 Tax=Bifidobacterium scardovii TaxID=158787 RepID=UPI0020702AD3|nr:HK97 family phage prohead protease [Bifidobacterium scardovii]MDU2421564.1 HK97 family phage prohead protease [Bifidobacterium scardovii]DAZ70523.1 MAG TPA: head maturation protease [Caudoviricetes sp.]